jgi:hypothetical protein
MGLFASHAQPAPLTVPHNVWAWPAVAGQVPAGFMGVQVGASGQADASVSAGELLPAGRTGRETQLWWVRAEPWTFCFAPWREQSPQAGLALTLRPHAVGDSWAGLAEWLWSCRGAVTDAVLAENLRRLAALSSLPPCATEDLLAERARWVNTSVGLSMGIALTSLSRVDLDLPAAPEPPLATAAADAAASASVAPPESAATLPWDVLVGRDEHACRRLYADLPRLDRRLRQIWGAHGWADDAARAQRQRRLQDRLNLLAATVGRPVSLKQQLGASRGPTPAQRRMIGAAALLAQQTLGEAWAALEAMVPGTVPTDDALERLEQVAEQLAEQVQMRLRAWWEFS